jgi:hypothetical protein
MTNWPPLFHASTPSNPLYKLTKLWTPSLFHNWYWSRGTKVRLSASGVLLKALWQLHCRYLVHQGGDCCSSASGQRTVCILVSYVSFSLSWVRGSTYLCNNNLCKTSHASSSYMIRHRSCLYFKKKTFDWAHSLVARGRACADSFCQTAQLPIQCPFIHCFFELVAKF